MGWTGKTLAFVQPGGGLVVPPIAPDAIANLLSEFSVSNGGLLDLVILNGCDSYELGKKVRQSGISTVVCWGTKTLDAAGRLFATTFFRELVSAGALDTSTSRALDAFKAAVAAITYNDTNNKKGYLIEGQRPLPCKEHPGRGTWPLPARGQPRRAGVPVLLTTSGNYTADPSGQVVPLHEPHQFQTAPGDRVELHGLADPAFNGQQGVATVEGNKYRVDLDGGAAFSVPPAKLRSA